MIYIGKREYRNHKWRNLVFSHMVADSIAELHRMAKTLGIENHFQDKPGKPHYDLCKEKKRLALKLGANEVDDRQIVLILRKKK